MPYIHWLDQIRISDRAWAGEKAAYLGELIHAGFDVPRGLSIAAEAYGDTLTANQLDQKISARLGATEIDDPVDLEQAAEEIRAWIESGSIPAPITQELKIALDSLDAKTLYAVRASRVVDDVPNPAASGMQQAYLGVPHDAVLDHIRKCWTVPWNSRAIYFRHRKKIDPSTLTMAVVVQPMLSADTAGVMFTANPLSGKDEIHIDATWGLGEAIIAARWKPDHFVVEKNSHTIQERVAATKNVMELVAPNGGLQSVAVDEDKQDVACLNDEQVVTLAALGGRVAAYFKSPQDIEWCHVGDKFFLLQTRPLVKR